MATKSTKTKSTKKSGIDWKTVAITATAAAVATLGGAALISKMNKSSADKK